MGKGGLVSFWCHSRTLAAQSTASSWVSLLPGLYVPAEKQMGRREDVTSDLPAGILLQGLFENKTNMPMIWLRKQEFVAQQQLPPHNRCLMASNTELHLNGMGE